MIVNSENHDPGCACFELLAQNIHTTNLVRYTNTKNTDANTKNGAGAIACTEYSHRHPCQPRCSDSKSGAHVKGCFQAGP